MGNGNQFKIWHVDIILISANPDMSHVVYDPNLVLACYPSLKNLWHQSLQTSLVAKAISTKYTSTVKGKHSK